MVKVTPVALLPLEFILVVWAPATTCAATTPSPISGHGLRLKSTCTQLLPIRFPVAKIRKFESNDMGQLDSILQFAACPPKGGGSTCQWAPLSACSSAWHGMEHGMEPTPMRPVVLSGQIWASQVCSEVCQPAQRARHATTRALPVVHHGDVHPKPGRALGARLQVAAVHDGLQVLAEHVGPLSLLLRDLELAVALLRPPRRPKSRAAPGPKLTSAYQRISTPSAQSFFSSSIAPFIPFPRSRMASASLWSSRRNCVLLASWAT